MLELMFVLAAVHIDDEKTQSSYQLSEDRYCPFTVRRSTVPSLILVTLTLFSCAPDWIQTDPLDNNQGSDGDLGDVQDEEGAPPSEKDDEGSDSEDSDSESSEDFDSESSEGSDSESSEGSDSESSEGSSEGAALKSGVWEPYFVQLVEDPCDWITQIPNFFASVEEANNFYVEQLFPHSFNVAGYEGGFEIKARNYGARGTIECEDDGADFYCETQTADSRNQYFHGFTYLIDFTGTVVNSQHVEGSVTVRYEVNEWWEEFLARYDVVVSECTQVYDLSLQYR